MTAEVSTDCGDVVQDGVIDFADLDALRQFLTGDPGAPDLQSDPSGLARCDVTGNGLCEIDDYARIKRYMLGLSGGMNETCPLAGSTYPVVELPAPSLDQSGGINTDRASVSLTGHADPGDAIRVTGGRGRPTTFVGPDGAWRVEVPLKLGQSNLLEVYRDYGAGNLSIPAQVTVNQNAATGTALMEGRVVVSGSVEPIPDVTITIGSVVATTDEFGRFLVEDLPAGHHVLRIEKEGFVPALVRGYANVLDWPVEDTGLNYESLVITLVPAAAPVTVDSAGATLTTPGGIELVIPAGSLSAPTDISLTELLTPDFRDFDGVPMVDIGPDTIVFDPPATLRIPLGFTLPAGIPIELARIDHAAETVSHESGLTTADGYIEVAVGNVTGTDYTTHLRLEYIGRKEVVTGVQASPGLSAGCDGRPRTKTITTRMSKVNWYQSVDSVLANMIRTSPSTFLRGSKEWAWLSTWDEVTAPAFKSLKMSTTFDIETLTYEVHLVQIPIDDVGQVVDEKIGTFEFDTVTNHVIEDIQVIDNDCPKPKGGAWGDPHLVRFDHVGSSSIPSNGNGRYDFQAGGEFVLFESTVDAMTVQTRFEALAGSPSISITKAAAFDLEGDRVMVDIDASLLRVRIDGVVTGLSVGVPKVLPGGGELERLAPTNGQDLVVARWSDGSSLAIGLSTSLGGHLNIYPELASKRAGEVQGLLGNANGIIGDDYNLRDGTPSDPSDLHTVYANSWRISQAESLFDYEPGEDTTTWNSVPPDTEFTLDDLDPAARAAAEAICISAGIDEDPLFSDCALDVALLGGAATGSALNTLNQLPDVGTYAAVFAQANIFQAGQPSAIDFGGGGGAGLLPTEVPLNPGTGRSMRILDRAGLVSFSSQVTDVPLDGVEFGELSWGDWGGVAGPRLRRMGQLMGVFLDSGLPSPVPASFDCGDVDGTFATPEIGQVFCIGDGLSFANEPQTFFIPDGATRLFLGHAERRTNQLIESAVHHLGDNYTTAGLFALDPNPEGRCFTSSAFDMPTGFTPSGARVRLDLAGTDIGSNSIWVNGQRIAYLPNTGFTTWLEDRAFTVNLSLLQATGNQIAVCSNGGNLDDFLFKNLRFEVAPPVVVQPEPSDLTPYHLGDLRGQFVGDGVGTGDWGLFANMPIPYGKSWTSPSFAVESPETLAGASVIIDIAQTDISNNPVYVNGTWVGNLPIRRDGTVWSANEEIPFDPSLLGPSGNRIEVRSGNLSGFAEVDDFMMRNVRLAVAQQDAAPPGGYADNTGFQELVIDFGLPTDSDGDGLTDAQEAALGTNPDEPDSDFDGISDFVEVNMDGNPDNYTPGEDTDPNNEDTDNDGIRDGDEVQNGTNPNDDTDYPGNGDFDSDGVLDVADVLGCTRIALRLAQEPVVPVESMRCDAAPLDGNGVPQPDQHVGAGDILVIQRRLLQLQ